MNQNTFTDQCTGAEFIARNENLKVCETKSGKMFFIGSTDSRGYISDEAKAFLEQEMAKPGASLKCAIALLAFSVIHSVDEETGEELVIPTLHLPLKEAKRLQNNDDKKSNIEECADTTNNTKFTDQCTGKEFVVRNSHLNVYETKSGKMFIIGTTDKKVYVTDEASKILKAEMAKPEASLKDAIGLLAFSIIHCVDEETDEELAIPTLHLPPLVPKVLWSDGDGKSSSAECANTVMESQTSIIHIQKKSPMDVLYGLVGLKSVKQAVCTLANLIKVQNIRKAKGLKVIKPSYHCVFTGNPGTGKTTVARILASIYHELGILERGQLIEIDRSGLVAEYIGQTAIKTNNIIDQALGGVLFIDEAYTLMGEGNDFGAEAIATLLKRMEDDRDKFVVILAGYPKEMKDFIGSNPGLQSRFSRYIEFPDYTSEELMQIFDSNLKKYELELTDEAKAKLTEIFEEVVALKDEKFGNGRYVRNIFDKTIEHQADRLVQQIKPSIKQLSEIVKEDIPLPIKEFCIANKKDETYMLQDIIGFKLGNNLILHPLDVGEIVENGEKDKILLQNFVDDEIKKYLPGLMFIREKNNDDFFKQLTMKAEMKLGFTYSIRLRQALIGMFFVDTPLYNKKTPGLNVWTIDFFLLPMVRRMGIMTIVIKRMLYLLKEKIGVLSVYAMVDKKNTNCINLLKKNFFEQETISNNKNTAYLYKCDLRTIHFNQKEILQS